MERLNIWIKGEYFQVRENVEPQERKKRENVMRMERVLKQVCFIVDTVYNEMRAKVDPFSFLFLLLPPILSLLSSFLPFFLSLPFSLSLSFYLYISAFISSKLTFQTWIYVLYIHIYVYYILYILCMHVLLIYL